MNNNNLVESHASCFFVFLRSIRLERAIALPVLCSAARPELIRKSLGALGLGCSPSEARYFPRVGGVPVYDPLPPLCLQHCGPFTAAQVVLTS